MLLFYVLSFFKKGDIIQGGTLFKGGYYLRKYGTYVKRNAFLKNVIIKKGISVFNICFKKTKTKRSSDHYCICLSFFETDVRGEFFIY